IDQCHAMVSSAGRCYAGTLPAQYGEFGAVNRESARDFLDRYAADRGPFGRGARLRWPGLALCRRAAELGASEALQRYERAMTSLIDEASRIGGVSGAGPSADSGIDDLDGLRRMLA